MAVNTCDGVWCSDDRGSPDIPPPPREERLRCDSVQGTFQENGETKYEIIPQNVCNAINLGLWGKETISPKKEILSNLFRRVEAALKEKCNPNAVPKNSNGIEVQYNEDGTLRVNVEPRVIKSSGFSLNGMSFCFSGDVKVGVELAFKVKDNKISLEDATYNFSKPVLAAGNIQIGFTAIFSVNNITIGSYDQAKTGTWTRPMVIALDKLKIVRDRKDSDKPALYEYVANPIYEKDKGWGSFIFESNKKECVAKTADGAPPGKYLGNGRAGNNQGKDECRYTQIGERTSEILLKWIFKNDTWEDSYDEYYEKVDENPVAAMFFLSSDILASGGPKCDYDALYKIEDNLAREYLNNKQ